MPPLTGARVHDQDARRAMLALMDNPLLDIDTTIDDGVAVVRLRGELDVGSAPALRTALQQLTGDVRRVDIDASGLEFVDSTGLGLLVALHRRIRESDGDGVRILAPHERVMRVLSITSLDTLLEIVPAS